MSGFIGAAIGIGLSYSGQFSVPSLGGAFATFGGITFTVVGSPTQLQMKGRSYYAKIEVVQAPPVLQWIYDDLVEIDMDIMLHYIWCTPSTVIDTFVGMRIGHLPQPLTIGSLNIGNFLIKTIDRKDTWYSDNGNLLVATLKLGLIQYVGQITQQGSAPGTTQAPPGSAVSYAPPPTQASPGTNYQGVSLQDAVRMGGNAITLAGNL